MGANCHSLSIDTLGGKQKINCANTEELFRIIQSIPSPKAEPFKRRLAKVGYERVVFPTGVGMNRMLEKVRYPSELILISAFARSLALNSLIFSLDLSSVRIRPIFSLASSRETPVNSFLFFFR